MTGLTLLFHLVFIIAPFGVLVSAQTCGNDIFAIANPQGEIQLQITADGTFTACNGTDLCSTLSQSTQQLTLENGLLSISNGNAVLLPDSSEVNELQSLGLNGYELSISGMNSVTLPQAKTAFASGPGNYPSQTLEFLSTTVSVTSNFHVLISVLT